MQDPADAMQLSTVLYMFHCSSSLELLSLQTPTVAIANDPHETALQPDPDQEERNACRT